MLHARGDIISKSYSGTGQQAWFLITIDTEGDNLWSRPATIETRNAGFIPRFQELCERHGLKPTYLTNHEMAMSDEFVEFGRDVLRRNAGEIGMHLHAWNSPPDFALPAGNQACFPYLVEYPEAALRDKVAAMTDLLEDRFGVKMLSHRAGRWALDAVYAKALLDFGYTADCSVTPHVSWRKHPGVPNGPGGSDYRHFPADAYFMDPRDISRPGDSTLVEVPMTILPCRFAPANFIRAASREGALLRRAADKFFPPVAWLRPHGDDLKRLLWILSRATAERRDYVEFMLHSSELMPGGSRAFPTERDIEALYDELAALFEAAANHYQGATLSNYAAEFCSKSAKAGI
jgi:hypothetical protein